MTAALSLSACNGKNSNAEIREYGKIVISVAKNSVGKLADVSQAETKIARTADVRDASVAADTKNQIIDLIFAQAADTTVEAVKYVFDDLFVPTAFLPAMCGDAVAEKYKANKFYGVPILLSDWGQYLITENEGAIKRSYVFMPEKTSWSDTDLFIVIDFDYRSETDFSFSMAQFSDDFSNRMYAYGNSDMEFFFVNRSVYENATRYETYCFRNGAAKTTESGEAAEACLSVLDSQFKSVNRDAVRAKFDSVEYEITNEDLEPHSEKYHGTIK